MSSSESEDMVISNDIGDVSEDMDAAIPYALPEKSKEKYELCYSNFTEWLKKKNFTSINEKVVSAYFLHKSTVQKPSSMWTEYSKLRTTIYLNNNVDISKFKTLLAFLKNKSDGYVPKKSKVFTKNEIDKFLLEAPDDDFLMMKVVLIIGVVGACRRDLLVKISTNDVMDRGDLIILLIKDTPATKEFMITDGCLGNASVLPIIRKYVSLRSDRTSHDRFFVCYRAGKCTTQPVGSHSISAIPKKIATYMGLNEPEAYTGHCFRRSSLSCYTRPKIYPLYPAAYSSGLNRNNALTIANVAEGIVKTEVEQNYVTSMGNITATSIDTNISGTIIKEEPREDLDPLAPSTDCTRMQFSEQIQSQGGRQVADGHYNHISLTYNQNGSTARLQNEISDSLVTDETKYFNSEMLKKIDVVVEQQRRQNDQLEKINSNFDRMNSNVERMNNNFDTLIEVLKGKFPC